MASKSLGPFNLGNPSEFSIIELIGQIEKLVGSKLNYKFLDLPVDDPKVRCPDITLAKQILGWNPKIGIENGLQLTLDWMKQNISLR
jgi:dTDP-glucose 4,6-dehydratase